MSDKVSFSLFRALKHRADVGTHARPEQEGRAERWEQSRTPAETSKLGTCQHTPSLANVFASTHPQLTTLLLQCSIGMHTSAAAAVCN